MSPTSSPSRFEDGEPNVPKVKKPRAQRSASDSEQRKNNKKAVETLKGSEDFTPERLQPVAQSIAILCALQYFLPPSDGELSHWEKMCILSASRVALPNTTIGNIPQFTFKQAYGHIVTLESRLHLLVQSVIATDKIVGDFRETFLREAAAIEVLPDAPGHDSDLTPMKCEFVGASLCAKHTSRIRITYENDAAPTQEVVISTMLIPLVKALLFQLRPRQSFTAAAAARITLRLRALFTTTPPKKTSKSADTTGKGRAKYSAIDMTVDAGLVALLKETDAKNAYLPHIQKQIRDMISGIASAPKKIDDVRKLILKAATAADAAKPAAGRMVFGEIPDDDDDDNIEIQ
jgi:hypothetical protein